jgi:2-polyprenyl-3-methyl-5-hydroxy-6-metoxy-1,4-benzoquinol methylase
MEKNNKKIGEVETRLIKYSDTEIERWDKEWLNYLLREYPWQLASYKAYTNTPPLPDNPLDLLDLKWGLPLLLFCHKEAIEGKAIMEMGCGAGNMGKLLARYCASYLGVDCSRIALAIAKLVSPENCTYLHVNEHAELKKFFGRIDTVVSRFFWIHQNMDMAKRALSFLRNFLVPNGLIYMDFFWPCPQQAKDIWKNTWHVLSPYGPLADEPSSTYKYSREDIDGLIESFDFKIVHHELHGETQRRYVVIEKCGDCEAREAE